MNVSSKMSFLGDAGQYDLCSGTQCKGLLHGSLKSSIYPAITRGGKCIKLFKTLMTNSCTHDCKYCVNRKSRNQTRVSYTPEELSNTFRNLLRLRQAEGLFLSSGIGRDPDATMSEMLRTVNLVRKYFRGYVHLKVLPGVKRELVDEACKLANRVSVNLETTPDHLENLTLDKEHKDLIRKMSWMSGRKANMTTQLIIGGDGENDEEVLKMVSRLYDAFELKRVYYSTFNPVRNTPMESRAKINPARGHRLYQADFLLRDYGFQLDEIKFNEGFMRLDADPKILAAMKNDAFPIDLNDAKKEDLVRIPGISPDAADRILKTKIKSVKELKSLGVITKRAMPFIKINGQRQMRLSEIKCLN